MSYDFGMKADLGNGDVYLHYEKNYTYNVSGMFYEAFGEHGIKFIQNQKGRDCIRKLREGLKILDKLKLDALR